MRNDFFAGGMKGRTVRMALSLSCLLAASWAFASGAVVAEHGDLQLTADELAAELAVMDPRQRETRFDNTGALGRLAQDYMMRRVLAERARAEGLDDSPELRTRLKLLEERVLYEEYLHRAEKAKINDEVVEALAQDEYRANREKFVTPEQIHARHILVAVTDERDEEEARDRARIVRARVLAGQDFDELAREYSDDRGSAARGGDLGFFTRGRMVAPFEEAAFDLQQPGDVSDVVQSKFGFHVIRLEERHEAGQRSYEEVKAQLVPAVRQRLRQTVRSEVVLPVRDPQHMKIHDDALEALLPND